MDHITGIPRYNKNQLLLIDGNEITLINYLKQLRTHKKITKKKISNLIKHNDYWYSQVERDGKNGDDNRQRTIYRTDLVNIISILVYDANTASDLEKFNTPSSNYLDKTIKAVPLKNSIRELNIFELNQMRTPKEQNSLFESLLDTHERLLRQTFFNIGGGMSADNFLEYLKNLNTSLRIDPYFTMLLAGQPYADFLYESQQKELDSLLRDLMNQVDYIIKSNSSGNVKSAPECLALLRDTIVKHTDKQFVSFAYQRVKSMNMDDALLKAFLNQEDPDEDLYRD